ncbi:MAG: TRAP transporter large permease [Deltaproteobacteria bacterium]|nr:TRAP transporter large permease [Deltaproteobacteria bacterium]
MISISISFIFLLSLGAPIAFCIGISALAGLIQLGDIPLLLIPHMMFQGTDSFPLLAVPFFVLAGALMNAGGITRRLVNFANLLVGHVRSGLALVNVVASMFFAGVTGAAVADTSAIGSVLIPAMREEGYDLDFSAAITAASSTMGPIIPPSIPMIIYGVSAEQSIGALFLAGIIPGLLIGLALMAVAYFSNSQPLGRSRPRGEATTWRSLLLGFKDALLALFMPAFILGGILAGVFTPTEAAAVSVLYAFCVGRFVYNELSWRQLPTLVQESLVVTAVIMFIIANAAIFGWLVAALQLPQKIIGLFTAGISSPWLILILINAFLLLVGTFMETTASLIILTPVLLPLAKQIGLDPIHFGAIMVLNLVIGLTTPPLGVCLFVSSGIAGISLERISRAMIPFLLAAIVVLLLVTYIPSLSLWIPQLFLQR